MFRTKKECLFVLVCFSLYCKVYGAVPQCCSPNSHLLRNVKYCSDNVTQRNLECKYGVMLLDPSVDESDTFYVDGNENLIINDSEPFTNYCLGTILRNNTVVKVALTCFEGSDKDFELILHRILMLLSVIFLLITLYIYTSIPKLRDLQGKCIIALIFCLISSFVTLLVAGIFIPNDGNCVVQAAFLYYFLLASFFWINIITFNIWNSIRNSSFQLKDKSWSAIYIGWGFGVPFFMVCMSFVLEHIPQGNHVRPRFGVSKCWFEGNIEVWSYFYGPVSILLILNVFMFLHSSWILWKNYRKSPISRIRSLKFRCKMYLKLFLLMGISWIFEVISHLMKSHPKTKYIWFITDLINVSQGIIIFLVLVVFRQKARLGLLERKLFNIKWPESWANEEIQESSTMSIVEGVELGNAKSKMITESLK